MTPAHNTPVLVAPRAQRWRVIRAGGFEVVVFCTRGHHKGREGWTLRVEMIAGVEFSTAQSAREAVAGSLVFLGCDDAAEIRGPGELTTAEQLATLRAEMEHLRGLVERASEQVHAVAEERDAADARANRLALDINTRDAILYRASQKLGWPSSLSVMSHWRDRMCTAVDETAGKISKLENLVAQARESYPRAEVLRMLDAAGAPAGGVVQRVAWLIEQVATLTQERDAALVRAVDIADAVEAEAHEERARLVAQTSRSLMDLARCEGHAMGANRIACALRDLLNGSNHAATAYTAPLREQVVARTQERDAALAAVDAVRAVQRSLSDEQLSAIRADAAEWVVPHDSCFGCLFDADRRDEGITAYVCSECRAPYCEEHRDCDKHDYSNERCGCDGKPVPWEPWSNNVERLAMAEELIAMRALVRGGDRG